MCFVVILVKLVVVEEYGWGDICNCINSKMVVLILVRNVVVVAVG